MALLLINLPAQAVGLTMNNSVLINTTPTTNPLTNGQIKPASSVTSYDNADTESVNEAVPFALAQPQTILPPDSMNRLANTTYTSESSVINPQITTLGLVANNAIYSQNNASQIDVLGDIQNRINQAFLGKQLTSVTANSVTSHLQKSPENINSNLEKSLTNTQNTISFNDANLVKQSNTLNLDLGLTKTLNNTAISHMSALQTSFNGQQLDATNLDGLDSMTNQLIGTNTRSQSAIAQWGPVSVTQSAPLLQQAHDMLSPLREQIRFQIDQQIKQAEIRLDPPELGKIELNVRLDGDRLHIQMHAANSVIRDAMLAGLDRLRSDLANDHGGLIDVDVSQGESQNKQQQDPNQPVISIAGMHESAAERTDPPQQDYVDLLA